MRVLLVLLPIFINLASGRPSNDGNYLNISPKQSDVLIHKQFYTHSGPEPPSEKKITFGKALKKFRVVFVNIPSPYEKFRKNGVKPYQITLAPVKDTLAVYVLSPKKNRQEIELDDLQGPPPTRASEPEVHFVKYKDEQDVTVQQTKIKDHYLGLNSR